jgi:hypothetical protein
LVSLVVVLLAAGGVTTWLLLKSPSAHSSPPVGIATESTTSGVATTSASASPLSTTPTTDTGTSTASPNGTSAQASQLSAFVTYLSGSASARGQTAAVVNAVGACQQDPATGITVLDNAALKRATDATAAGQQAVDAIPGGAQLQTDLIALLNDSALADKNYAQWMRDIQTQGCPVDTATDPAYQQADLASQVATTDKQDFLAIWNPLAIQYSLPTYTADQL